MRNFCIAVLLLISGVVHSQYLVTGRVVNNNGQSLGGSTIVVADQYCQADVTGRFKTPELAAGKHLLKVSFMGYKTLDTLINLQSSVDLHLHHEDQQTLLDQIVVGLKEQKKMYNSERISQSELSQNFAGSFAKTLERLPGVNAMEIGAGASKPVIRGLGFNRVAVSENGAKQEGQQWGADHGLEIDALNTEAVEVIKGVGTIEYGSDAIGGVIQINNEIIPKVHSFSGQATLLAKSVNDALGASFNVQSRSDRFFFKFKATAQEYGDYRVPTDQIVYLSTHIPIFNQRMKNTAGKEMDLYGQLGYVGESFQNILSISNVYNKSGFFPGSHGLPSIGAVQPDGDSRNIASPFQNVNHFKVTNSALWTLNQGDEVKLVLSYQNNKRQEWSKFHTHFANQKPPEINPDLELDFDLSTFDLNAKYVHISVNNHKTSLGFQQNYQNNTVGGFEFLLPKFNKSSLGLFGIHEHQFTDAFAVQLGARVDYAQIQIRPYYDEVLYGYLLDRGQTPQRAAEYAQRSTAVEKSFSSFNAMVGAKWALFEQWNFSATAGTNFRFPTAIELSANGIHHGAFRHELGNANLDPERGMAFDFRVDFESGSFKTQWSPYVYYFNNYIFLKPTGSFSVLPDGGQVYQYTQSKALLTGMEWRVEQRFLQKFKVDAVLEYLYNKQLTDQAKTDYPLPFSPPVNVFAQLTYELNSLKAFRETQIFVNVKWADQQSRIAQNEDISPSYKLFGAGVSSDLALGKWKAKLHLTASNLLNTKALNHMSFYRPLEIPELGRSVQLMIQFPF